MPIQKDLFDQADFPELSASDADIKDVISVTCMICRVDEDKIYMPRTGRVATQNGRQDTDIRKAKSLITLILWDCLHLHPTKLANIFRLKDTTSVYYRRNKAHELLKEEVHYRTSFMQIVRELRQLKYRQNGQAFAHEIAAYILTHKHMSMPRALVVELNRVDQWLKPFGFKLALKRIKKDGTG